MLIDVNSRVSLGIADVITEVVRFMRIDSIVRRACNWCWMEVQETRVMVIAWRNV